MLSSWFVLSLRGGIPNPVVVDLVCASDLPPALEISSATMLAR
jgi:hypothetical protein